jgi:hypothetical protein
MSKEQTAKQMKKKELITELITVYNYSESELKGWKRPQLIKMVMEERSGKRAQKILDNISEPSQESAKEPEKSEEIMERPDRTSHDWATYVLTLFEDDELAEGNPKVDGLRRIAEKLLGTILEERTDVIECPNAQNGFRSTVKATVVFDTPQGQKKYDGVGEVSSSNCDMEFARFGSSTAETRAKGRAFRAALALRHTVSAEEITSVPVSYSINEGGINPAQITAIRLIADRNKIGIAKLLHYLEINKQEIKELSQEEAVTVMQNLNKFQQHVDNIPEKILRD